MIGATASGLGKTSLTIALTAAFGRRGLRVQTFKAGPDFLDPTWLALVSGRPCYNLDGWMCGHEYVKRLYARATEGADVAIIEGVMGLFDGADPATIEGSTAELARWLEAPVLLMLNGHGAARSLAATVQGFANFEAGVTVGGVILNSCASRKQGDWLRESLCAAGLPPLAGTLPQGAWPSLPRRHLGLVAGGVAAMPPDAFDAFAEAAERHLDVDGILALAGTARPLDLPCRPSVAAEPVVRVGLARDAAFHFYYPDNLEALEAAGCELVPFSPLEAAGLPEGLGGVYFGGGYPEEHAAELEENTAMLESVRRFAAAGHPVYAECGGLMYLSRGIETKDGRRHRMVGLLPVWTRMLPRRKALGYVEAAPVGASLFAGRGACLRGHEFHYSEIALTSEAADEWEPAYRLRRRRDVSWTIEGYQQGNVQASYVHVHFASHPGAAARFTRLCQESRV